MAKSEDKDNFLFCHDWLFAMQNSGLNEQEIGGMLIALVEYDRNGTIPEPETIGVKGEVLFNMIRLMMDKNNRRYSKKVEQTRKAGKASASRRAQNSSAEASTSNIQNQRTLTDSTDVNGFNGRQRSLTDATSVNGCQQDKVSQRALTDSTGVNTGTHSNGYEVICNDLICSDVSCNEVSCSDVSCSEDPTRSVNLTDPSSDHECSVRGESFSTELDHVLAHDLKTPLTPLEGGDHLRDHADAQPAEADSAEKNPAEGAPSEKPEKPKHQRKPAKGTLSPEVADWFDNEFWPSYPRKISKQKARETIAKINPDAETREAIMQGLDNAKRFNESWQRREDLRYVPHATTWLNQRRWEDEYDTSHELTVVGGEVTVKKTAEERHQELNEKRGIHQPFDPKIPLSKQFPRMGLTEELRNELMAEYVQEQFEEYGVRYII